MEKGEENIDILPHMFYGDALGFLKENSDTHDHLQPFSYLYDQNLELEMQKGQWSYITQLTLISCKCFIDNEEKNQVLIDYERMEEEIKLWQYYRCGTPLNYMNRLDLGEGYYTSDFYWEDKRGEAFSRIIPIALVNKNFIVAQKEAYKNIIYINRHPKVILTGLLLLRTIYLLTNNMMLRGEELVDELKKYLIDLQFLKLEQGVKEELPVNYKIKFEQEKIDYLIDLDRIKAVDFYNIDIPCSKNIFLLALTNFFRWCEGEKTIEPWKCDQKEAYTITHALLALSKQIGKIETDKIKDIIFIERMNKYLFKLKNYKIGREPFKNKNKGIDLFTLQKGAIIRHPILNNIIIKDKIRLGNHIELIVGNKTGEYRFLRREN